MNQEKTYVFNIGEPNGLSFSDSNNIGFYTEIKDDTNLTNNYGFLVEFDNYIGIKDYTISGVSVDYEKERVHISAFLTYSASSPTNVSEFLNKNIGDIYVYITDCKGNIVLCENYNQCVLKTIKRNTTLNYENSVGKIEYVYTFNYETIKYQK